MSSTTLPFRRVLPVSAALAGVLTLSACGSGSGGGQGAGGGDGAKTRTVTTAMGEVQVPAEPKRVVVLDTAELDSAVTLGVKPVGATRTDSPSGFPAHLPAGMVKDVKIVGQMLEPSMEAILALKPDLILTSKLRHGGKYAELKQIAPTVMTEGTGPSWKENFLVHAKALGKEAEAGKTVADYSARAAEVTAALGGKKQAGRTKVSMVRFVEGMDVCLYGKKNYIGTVLADVGLDRPPVTDQAKDGFILTVSPENIDRADADVIFHSVYGDPKKAKVPAVTGGPLWKNLTAVKNDRVHAVNDALWMQGIGYTAADKILGELQEALTA
ncbi:ABC transporter substrate-binding protein [Streptomyces uncialis]|uniref:ABC transporter substrate-binding protein n=1 Tax=Streptomyces uncialis TaxID=1048205 RepID=UPI00225501AB|nr:iron-siderophore ABC transporter substrate-binding protein [Streptomyces uncialis]MCX4661737.1 iron-siderophore ABC transporter substrate-binding protein [Streptomyces uncialis]